MPSAIGEWSSLLVNATVLLAAVGALLAIFRKWIRKVVAEPLGEVNKQLATRNGVTVAGYAETTSDQVRDLIRIAEENRVIANRADLTAEKGLTMAQFAHTRLDQHLHERTDNRG